MISQELLDEVLNVHVRHDFYFDCETLVYKYDKIKGLDECYNGEINIYELANKCKEWAFGKGGIDITSGKRLGLDGWECLIFDGTIPCHAFIADTEPEAIFKACELIMENNND